MKTFSRVNNILLQNTQMFPFKMETLFHFKWKHLYVLTHYSRITTRKYFYFDGKVAAICAFFHKKFV